MSGTPTVGASPTVSGSSMISIWENSTRRLLELQADPGVDVVGDKFDEAMDEDDKSKAMDDDEEE